MRISGSARPATIDAVTGEVVSDHASGERMLPASNMKIVTAVTSLAALLPAPPTVLEVAARFAAEFGVVFQRQVRFS